MHFFSIITLATESVTWLLLLLMCTGYVAETDKDILTQMEIKSIVRVTGTSNTRHLIWILITIHSTIA